MLRLVAAAAGGLMAGAAAVWILTPDTDSRGPDAIVRDIVDVPAMSIEAAAAHRDAGYAEIRTIAAIQALPTPFARLEALYALAGRSEADRVQALIFEANRIADDVAREEMLGVLFYRLGEADPASALALTRTDYFAGMRTLERLVWRAWSRHDLDEALFAAKTQASASRQNTAAQSLYAAWGFMGNETTDRIHAELGFAPDRATRAQYLYQLADRSPAEAVRFIESLPFGIERGEYVNWLAYHLDRVDPASAPGYADLFQDKDVGDVYRNWVASNAARANPRAVVDRVLASGNPREGRGDFYTAMSMLASEDLDLVMQYFEQVTSEEHKQWISSIIAEHLVRKDPVEALAWAREHDRGQQLHLEMTILMQIARRDPELALTEAQRASNVYARDDLISNVIHQMTRDDPQKAIRFLDRIADRGQREQMAGRIASRWMQHDPDAALEWILGNEPEVANGMLMSASHTLVRSDIDAAIRLLPRLDGTQQASMRMQIAARLATTRSPEDAQAFVRQFANEPGYEQLQTAVIEGVAQSDRMLARQMADQLVDARARDAAYARIVGQFAQDDPRAAAGMLASMTDARYIAAATAQVATHWYNVDPDAANRWVASLPPGSRRDDAIMNLAGLWADPTREQLAMIDAIADADKRGQAKLHRVYRLMRVDPERARTLLEDPDIPSHARERIEINLKNFGISY